MSGSGKGNRNRNQIQRGYLRVWSGESSLKRQDPDKAVSEVKKERERETRKNLMDNCFLTEERLNGWSTEQEEG